MANSVRQGSTVDLQFVLSVQGGTVVDQTEGDELLQVTLGSGELAPALEKCLIGMKVGERRQFVLPPEAGFGPSDPDNIVQVPKERFPPELELKEGLVIGFDGVAGEDVPGTILAVNERTATVDFNHPLAGLTLLFDVTVVRICED